MRRAEAYKRTAAYQRDLQAARTARQRRELKKATAKPKPSFLDKIAGGVVGKVTGLRVVSGSNTEQEARRTATLRALERKTMLRKKTEAPVANKVERALKAGEDAAARHRKQQQHRAEVVAPALKVLNQTMRPTRAIAGATEKVVEGHPEKALGAAKKGLIENKGPAFGQVLRKAGVTGGVAETVGFGLDVATDPTTYLSLGAGTVAKKAAEKAARDTLKRATRAGIQKETAQRLAKTAAQKAERKAVARGGRETAGAVVRFGKHEVPGVRRATAAVSKPIRRVAPESVKRGGRESAAQMRPQIAPHGVTRVEHEVVRRVERRARASRAKAIREGVERGRLYARKLSKEEHEQVLDAIERKQIGKLPERLREPAIALRSEFRQELRESRRAGMFGGVVGKPAATRVVQPSAARPGKRLTARVTRPPREPGAPKEYVPRVLEDIIEGGRTRAERGSRILRPTSSKRREASRGMTIAEYNKANPEERFSTNIPLIYANYRIEQGVSRAQSRLNRDIAERAGRPIKPGQGATRMRENESIYHLQGGRLMRLDDAQAGKVLEGRIAKSTGRREKVVVNGIDVTRTGRLVALNEQLVERAKRVSADERTAPGRVFDTAQRGWKRVATATPGFHVRNMFGDVQLAYFAQAGQRLPGTTGTAARGIKRLSEREAAQRNELIPRKGIHAPRPADEAQRLARRDRVRVAGRDMSLNDFVDFAVREGAVRSAQVGRELEEFRFGAGELGKSGAKKLRHAATLGRARQAGAAPFRTLNRWAINREDLMRLSTFKYGLDEGLSKEEAADLAMAFHIDYTDVTPFERTVARRVAPFYTFSARALPINVKTLVQRPGKLANLEKARVEVANAFGLSEDWEGDVTEWKQRAVPFGVKIGDEDVALDVQLPVSLLNEFPTTLDPKDYLLELARFGGGLLTPAIKIPIEAITGQSLAFRKPIKPDYRHYVAAPSWATHLPEGLRKQLDIVNDYIDPRSGEKVPGWSPWTNYWFSQLPGLAYQFRQLTTEGSLQSGRHDWQKISSTLGVKGDPVDHRNAVISELYQESFKIQDRLDALRDRGRGGGRGSKFPEVVDLTKQLADIDYQIYRQSVMRKDRAPLKETSIPNKKLLKPRVKQRGMPKGGRRGRPPSPFADPLRSSGAFSDPLKGKGF